MADQTQKIRRALISVYDKTGIVEFARALVDEFGIEIISTGGTAKLLTENNIPVTLVEDVTGFPEMLDGRVKTLHPKIHAAILADRDNPEHMRQLADADIKPIDMVVVNLYPFEKTIAREDCTFEQAIEMIDIGGVALLRAAAKNHKHVFVYSRSEYDFVLRTLRGDVGADDRDRRYVATTKVFQDTARYDAQIASWLSSPDKQDDVLQSRFIEVESWGQLRYGENSHQTAELLDCNNDDDTNLTTADSISGCQTGMSFNNYVDADSAVNLCSDLARAKRGKSVCVFVKHTNACGAAWDDDRIEAYRKAYLADPNAAMGGVLAVNFEVDVEFAAAVMETYQRWGKPLHDAGASYAPGGFFAEVWAAPAFRKDAVGVIRGEADDGPKKDWGRRVRWLEHIDVESTPNSKSVEYRSISGGMLVQSRDVIGLNEDQWKVVTQRTPTDREMNDLRLAWLICKHTKSNAITICRDGMLIGNGAGQMSRVMSCRVATWLARENGHLKAGNGGQDKGNGEQGTGNSTATPVAASDAFFPFRDGLDVLVDAGVTAVIQPGGSKRDEEVIAAADERGVAMIFTGTRHFKH